jgi:hypothetical protein
MPRRESIACPQLASPGRCGMLRSVVAPVLSPFGATPFAGVVSQLAPLWQPLRALAERPTATAEEEQALHLIEYLTSRFGAPLLAAGTLDELDDELDELVDSHDVLHCTALLTRYAALFERSETVSAARFADVVGESLGDEEGRAISDARQIMDAWLDAQRQAAALYAGRIEDDSGQLHSLASAEIPAELAQSVFHSRRAVLCCIAIARAIYVAEPVEPWLAHGLIERLVTSAKEHLRLLASLPGVTVDEAIVPPGSRLDLAAMEARHRRAQATSQRALELARTRLGM